MVWRNPVPPPRLNQLWNSWNAFTGATQYDRIILEYTNVATGDGNVFILMPMPTTLPANTLAAGSDYEFHLSFGRLTIPPPGRAVREMGLVPMPALLGQRPHHPSHLTYQGCTAGDCQSAREPKCIPDDTATFTVNAQGTHLRYQWQRLDAEGNWINLLDGNRSSLQLANRASIGAITGLNENWWGKLDDLRIYNRDLNAMDIDSLSRAGAITTIAGAGATFIEGAQALNVKLERDGGSDPNYKMCLDGAGNLYFQRVENISFNGGNHRSFPICKIAPNGVVTTVAGGGTTLPNDNVSLAATDVLFLHRILLLSTLR